MNPTEKVARDRVRGEMSSLMDELQGITPQLGASKILNRLYAYAERRYEANKFPKRTDDEFEPKTVADLIDMRDKLNWAAGSLIEAERELSYAIERALLESEGDKAHKMPVYKGDPLDEVNERVRHRMTSAQVKFESAYRYLVSFLHRAYGQDERGT